MNRKGLYSAIVALAGIVIMITVMFNVNAQLEGKKLQSYSVNIIETKVMWEKARYVLDKTTSDMFSDMIGYNCWPNPAEVVNEAEKYFQNSLDEIENSVYGNMWCEFENVTGDIPVPPSPPCLFPGCSANVTVSGTLKCYAEQTISSGATTLFSAFISKDFKFEKSARYEDETVGVDQCRIIEVRDMQSDIVEISDLIQNKPS